MKPSFFSPEEEGIIFNRGRRPDFPSPTGEGTGEGFCLT
jgi:hypothetical protein